MSFLLNEIYDEIPKEVLNTNLKSATEFVSDLIRSAVPPKEYDPTKFSKTILPIKIKQRPSPKAESNKAYVTKKIRKKLNLTKCPKTGWIYNKLVPMRELWASYMQSHFFSQYKKYTMNTIQGSNSTYANNVFAKADYHGAEMRVVRSKNPSLVGISGICIIDTQNTFKLVSKDNKCRTIPKQDCVFEMDVFNVKLTIYGKLMAIRPADRSTKKIKSLMRTDL